MTGVYRPAWSCARHPWKRAVAATPHGLACAECLHEGLAHGRVALGALACWRHPDRPAVGVPTDRTVCERVGACCATCHERLTGRAPFNVDYENHCRARPRANKSGRLWCVDCAEAAGAGEPPVCDTCDSRARTRFETRRRAEEAARSARARTGPTGGLTNSNEEKAYPEGAGALREGAPEAATPVPAPASPAAAEPRAGPKQRTFDDFQRGST